MNIKEFKKQIKNEELNIPDVREKVKNSSIFINREIIEEPTIPLIRNKNWFRITLSTAILVLVAIVSIVMLIPSKNSGIEYESSPINYLQDKNELVELVNYYEDNTTFVNRFIDFIGGLDFSVGNVAGDVIPEGFEPTYDINVINIEDANILYSKAADSTVESSSIKALEVSETNKQVANVDEADIVKSDGKNIYRCYDSYVLINAIDKGIVCETRKLVLADPEKYYINDQNMYLTDDYLVVIFFTYERIERKNWFRYYYSNSYINVNVYDKETLELKKDYKANYVTFNESRVVNGDIDVLYLVFNQSVYRNKDVTSPYDYVDGEEKTMNLTSVNYYDGCRTENYTYIVSIKLDESLEIKKNVTLGPSYWNGIYATDKSIYLYDVYGEYEIESYLRGEYKWSEMTTIVKYSIDNGEITPFASLSTKGEIISQFALSEYDGYLRLVSSIVNENKLEIYKLGTNENSEYQFVLVGSITKGLGEKNEEIKSVNFKDKECIVVTAKQTDPMYKIDLSDPTNPKILGKFKEDGYNSYLQYLTGDLEGLAIGIGYLTHDISDTYNVKDCTKFGLYDVSGDDPVQLNLITYDCYYMEACYNHKALFVYKNYVGFEENGIYHLYEIVKNTNGKYEVKETIKYDYQKNTDYYSSASSRMYYVDGYFYLSFVDPYSLLETAIVSFNSDYQLLNEVSDTLENLKK